MAGHVAGYLVGTFYPSENINGADYFSLVVKYRISGVHEVGTLSAVIEVVFEVHLRFFGFYYLHKYGVLERGFVEVFANDLIFVGSNQLACA